MTDLGTEILEKKIANMQNRLTEDVDALIKAGVHMVDEVKGVYRELDVELNAHPELIDDVIADRVIAETKGHLPWYCPEFIVRLVISKAVAAMLKRNTIFVKAP